MCVRLELGRFARHMARATIGWMGQAAPLAENDAQSGGSGGVRFVRRPLSGLEPGDEALLIVPQGHLRVGRERLQARGPVEPSELDRQIQAAAAPSEGGRPRVSVFCGRALDDSGSWGFAEDLEPAELDELGIRLLESQILTMRCLFLAGVGMHVHIDFGRREQVSLRLANGELLKKLVRKRQRTTGLDHELADLDAWLLREFVFNFSVSVERLLDSTFGDNAHAVRSRIRKADERRAALSDEARAHLGG